MNMNNLMNFQKIKYYNNNMTKFINKLQNLHNKFTNKASKKVNNIIYNNLNKI